MLANSTAAAKKTDQPGIWENEKSYLLNPENSKTFLILSQPKMCQKYTFLLPRAHFLGATGAPTEPVHESLLKTPILSRPTAYTGHFLRRGCFLIIWSIYDIVCEKFFRGVIKGSAFIYCISSMK